MKTLDFNDLFFVLQNVFESKHELSSEDLFINEPDFAIVDSCSDPQFVVNF